MNTQPHNRGRPAPTSASRIWVLAIVVSACWLVGAGVFLFGGPLNGPATSPEPQDIVVKLLGLILPVMVFWLAASVARSWEATQSETVRLAAAVTALRHSFLTEQQARTTASKTGTDDPMTEDLANRLERIESLLAQLTTEEFLQAFSNAQPAAVAPPVPAVPQVATPDEGDGQTTLALGTPAEDLAPLLSTADYISALNFPDDPDDKAGFAALRRALRHRGPSRLIRASQDILTLLSQDGVYMDDLRPELARPELWRRFARGERGPSVSGLAGIRDRSSLALAAGRMREDTIFRDSAHHFLRLFDKQFSLLEPTASDAEIVALSETRTARAFMLLGRVTGTFN